ncbi:pyridoxal-phosphate dependent enzyme [Halodesulfurarchaeum sp. HSR-GB]|uniref:PLP-dependent cysteine synthase family protein n=1 Tax=Halodesulfurarchaeum sp. HSR-GB TaxID=3074077 RepID=UPI00285A06C1|nr:pyridoxal-phosphate dependent enzyme [Halodesulfurarchaeum sp. HSR-GB]MDR5656969.1 pyridoxal-phosphate dependent enzyme [Halodesulfurarchaeum sp. HSR-GB]
MPERAGSGPVAERLTDLVGETPILHLKEFAPNLYGKVESFNPLSSVKDRVAVNMLERAAANDELDAETTVVEATSGNTGIGLAFAGAAMGYEVCLVMPESMSEERRQILRGLGADLELTPAEEGMPGAIERADAIAATGNTYRPRQFENPANPAAHRTETGPEIEAALDQVDVLVASVGTGGTITGIAQYFKRDLGRADFEVVAIEPADSRVLEGGEPGNENIPGIGAGFVPDVLELALIDTVERTTPKAARETARELARETGLLAGVSAGAAVNVATSVAKSDESQTVVTILPDTGERYLLEGVFE